MMHLQLRLVLASWLLLSTCDVAQAGPLSPKQRWCKAVPGTADWPSPELWGRLNATVSGRLIRPVPPGAVCHQDQPGFDPGRCLATQLSWPSQFFHVADPVSVNWNNWANDTCLPDPRLACSDVGYPVYVINATTTEHVQAGVRFAKEHNIRLVVKNSGHDYLGRSNGAFSLSIWVHNMKGIQVHEGDFEPRGCKGVRIPGVAITAAAGTQMLEAYAAADALNRTVIGGNGRTVALGGYVTGGGHSILSPHYGLAVDHVLQMEMVDPSGNLLVLNECENEELFFAMRGGGGSTFGVLTSVTLGTIPSPRMMALRFSITTDSANPHAFDMLAYFLSQVPDLVDAGVSGYPVMHSNFSGIVATGGSSNLSTTKTTGIVGNVAMLDTERPRDILDVFEALFLRINAAWPAAAGVFSFSANTTAYPSFYDWYLENYDPTPAGHSLIVASRLLDKGALTGNLTASRLALETFLEGGVAGVYMVSGKGVWDSRARGERTAVNPRWREAYAHAATGIQFPPQNPQAAAAASARAKTWSKTLGELGGAGEGAYINEAHPDEDNWQWLFWGAGYRNLVRIKRAVDPENVFWCHPCVGSEAWELLGDGRLCRADEGGAGAVV